MPFPFISANFKSREFLKMLQIIAAEFPQHLAVVRELFSEYASALGVDLSLSVLNCGG
jgi:hypothetical protein